MYCVQTFIALTFIETKLVVTYAVKLNFFPLETFSVQARKIIILKKNVLTHITCHIPSRADRRA